MSVETSGLGDGGGVRLPKSWLKEEPELMVPRKKKKSGESEKTPLRIAFEGFYQKYLKDFESIPFPLDQLSFEIAHRFFLLDKAGFLSETFKTITCLRKFFAFYNTRHSEVIDKFSTQQQRTVFLATLLSDIGKTGPEDIGYQERCLHTAMFSIHGIPNPKMSVHDFIAEYKNQLVDFIRSHVDDIEDNADQILVLIEKMLGKKIGNEPMLSFYSWHVDYSFRIVSGLRGSIDLVSRFRLRNNKITAKVLAAIAGHHYLSGMRSTSEARSNGSSVLLSKTGYVSDLSGLGHEFELNMPYSREMALVFLFDVYMAQIERPNSSGSHKEVIQRMRDIIGSLVQYEHHRQMFQSLLGEMEICFGG